MNAIHLASILGAEGGRFACGVQFFVMRVFVRGIGLALLATPLVALSAACAGEGSGVSAPPLALDRPEVRPAECPSNAAMVADYNRWTMTIGPVVMNFAPGAVGPEKEVFAGKMADGRLAQKIPLHIAAEPGTPFSLMGTQLHTTAPMQWDGPTAMPTIERPIAERYFVPGAMFFPEAGCYQVFVEVEGERYGPFGFEVRG